MLSLRWMLACAIVAAAGAARAEEAPVTQLAEPPAEGATMEFPDETAKLGYALGQQIGESLATNGVPKESINTDFVAKGLLDKLDGKEGISPLDRQRLVRAAMMKGQEVVKAQQAKLGEAAMAEGKKYLEENAKKEGVKSTPSGLQYKVITEGTGAKPSATSTVKVHYKGTLTNGNQFDSSYDRGEPAEFPLNGVIPGWTEGLQLMSAGSKYQFYIPSELAYGPRAQPEIPANSVLVFDVELLEIVK